MEKKVREQLEEQITILKHDKEGKPTPQLNGSNIELEDLKRIIREYEEKLLKLESEVNEWQQRYLEESTLRQIAVDAASLPKDAKIAALERTSQESEKLIALVRTEKLKQMDELYAAHRKTTEMEGRIKDLESKLAERDAMIKVLQQHSQEKNEVLQNAVLGRPSCHIRAASTVGLSTNTSHTATTVGSSLGASSVMKVKSSECLTTVSTNGDLPISSNLNDSKKSLDEQMEELDSRLSNKDSIIHALRAEKQRYPNHFWRL
ncbi:angiomotin-like [Limulus polyphemus]|uniref:Angiomotin-like n=1 Tax=Limulus polyphemus TaxID=6850 RepID=A0ABM1SY36_LIMPO|nr:angiomotin-like [Limulus polyphemus]